MVGQKFGSWVVIEKDLVTSNAGYRRWICECSCQTRRSVVEGSLLRGISISCGCRGAVTSRQIGRFTLIERYRDDAGKLKWLCKCTCGEMVVKTTSHLKRDADKLVCRCKVNKGIVGQMYGYLVVVADTGRTQHHCKVYLCRCRCGKLTEVKTNSLQSGNTKSCGCYMIECSRANVIDLVGKRFGQWQVLERAETPEGCLDTFWSCLCNCGVSKVCRGHDLRDGKSTCCGAGHHRRDPNISDEERLAHRDTTPGYLVWRKTVLERDNALCQACKIPSLPIQVHHLNGWKWCVEERVEVSNGICLCGGGDGCHVFFHLIYGRGDNTKEQFAEFLARVESGELLLPRLSLKEQVA